MAILLGREEITLADGTVVAGQPTEVAGGVAMLEDSSGVVQLGTTVVTGILEVDGQTIIDASGSGEGVQIDGNVDIQGKFVDGVEVDLQGQSNESFQVRVNSSGPVALQIDGGDFTSATNQQGQSVAILLTHLPTYADQTAGNNDSALPSAALFADQTGALFIKV